MAKQIRHSGQLFDDLGKGIFSPLFGSSFGVQGFDTYRAEQSVSETDQQDGDTDASSVAQADGDLGSEGLQPADARTGSVASEAELDIEDGMPAARSPLPTFITPLSKMADADSGTAVQGPFRAQETEFTPVTYVTKVGTSGNDSLTGTVGADVLVGLAGDDTLIGKGGKDTLLGGDGNDDLRGGNGNDSLNPGDNNYGYDFIRPGAGNDTVNFDEMGSTGYSELIHDDLNAGITAHIDGQANTGIIDKHANGTTFILDLQAAMGGDVFKLIGSSFDDVININPYGFMGVAGGDGDDVINIGAGSGTVRVDYRNDGPATGITANLNTGTIVDSYGKTDLISGHVDELRSTMYSDSLRGGADNDRFILMAGDDTVNGAGGWDQLRYDRSQVGSVDINLATGIGTGVWRGQAFTHTISNIEEIRGSRAGADNLTGDGNDNAFRIGQGDDSVNGGGGTDTVRFNELSYQASIVRNGDSVVVTSSEGTDVLLNVEFLNFWDQTIDVSTLFNTSNNATSGNDFLLGGAAKFNINGLGGDDSIYGQGANDRLTGGNGNDLINGGGGNDTLKGGAGNDTIIGGAGNDYMNPGENIEGFDVVIGGTGNDTVDMGGITLGFVQIEYNTLNTGIVVTIDGNANTGTVDKGVNGTDTLIDVDKPMGYWGFGLVGTHHDDTYNITVTDNGWGGIWIHGGSNAINIGASTGSTLRIGYQQTTTGITANLETGEVSNNGHGGSDAISNPFGQIIELEGTRYADNILGSSGGDRFILRQGDDTLDGGDGTDLLRYDRGGVSAVDVDLGGGIATGQWESWNPGSFFTHTISNIENVRGSRDDGDTLTGNAADNHLDGRGGNDTLTGAGGDDTLVGGTGDDVLKGGDGKDYITGDDGNDTLNGGNGSDQLFGGAHDDLLNGGGGKDYLSGADGTDRLVGGGGNDTLSGGAGNDELLGGNGNDLLLADSGNNVMTGGGGSDVLMDGTGDDTMTGGGGQDSFAFANNFGTNVITDFSANNAETIDLSAVTAITGFNDLVNNHLVNAGGTAQIKVGGNTILLQGVAFGDVGAGQLYSADDFLFV